MATKPAFRWDAIRGFVRVKPWERSENDSIGETDD